MAFDGSGSWKWLQVTASDGATLMEHAKIPRSTSIAHNRLEILPMRLWYILVIPLPYLLIPSILPRSGEETRG